MTLSYPSTSSANDWADWWRKSIGVNVIPADTANKRTWIPWSQYQNNPISQEQHDQWKQTNAFDKGMALIVGKIWHNKEKSNLYLWFIDIDNQLGIDEFVANVKAESLKEIAQKVLVEQHSDDRSKCHIYGYSSFPFKKKSGSASPTNDIPKIEVKGLGTHGIAYCSPSPHKSGSRYKIIGSFDLEYKPEIEQFEAHIDNIYTKYGLTSSGRENGDNLEPIENLFKATYIVYEGQDRHGKLLRVMESLIKRNLKILSEGEIKANAMNWNTNHCIPSLPLPEFEKQWKDAVKFIERKNMEQQQENNNGNYGYDDSNGSRTSLLEEGNNSNFNPKSVLQTKRIHQGSIRVQGRIVTVSEMYVIQTPIPSNGILYKDAKFIQLEDTEKLDENERLDVILYDDLTTNVIAGEVVDIEGRISIESKSKNSKKKIVVVHAESISYVNRKELTITAKDIVAFERFVKYPKLTERLVSMFAPNVIGHDDVKLGLLRSIVGGDDHGQNGTGRVNTFMVGDPGTAKSTLGNEATKIKPNSRHVSAPHASSKTITAIVDKENESVTLRLGAIPLASYAICAIDEITAFPPEEQARLLDVLQEGILDTDKHGRHFKIPAPTTIIATANPIQSRWTEREVISNDEVNLLKTLLDRFQQIYAFRDDMNEKQTSDFSKQMSTMRKRKPHNYTFLRKFLVYASAIKIKCITPEAEFMLNEFWKKAKIQKRLSIRMYRGLFNIAEAQAKLHLKDVVNSKFAEQAMESVRLMMVQYGETVKITTNPRELTYSKCLEILRETQGGITSRSLIEMACKSDVQINEYIGRNWTMDGNIKIKVVVDMLRNHSKVKVVGSKPIILQWIEEEKSIDNSVLSDTSDTSDPKIVPSYSENIIHVDPSKPKSGSDTSDISDRNSHSEEPERCPKCHNLVHPYNNSIHYCS